MTHQQLNHFPTKQRRCVIMREIRQKVENTDGVSHLISSLRFLLIQNTAESGVLPKPSFNFTSSLPFSEQNRLKIKLKSTQLELC